MRVPFYLFLCLTTVAAQATDQAEHLQEWKEWNAKFNYTDEDDSSRLIIYLKSKELIDTHNEMAEQGKVTFFLDINRFAHMTLREVINTRTGFWMSEYRRASPISTIEIDIPFDVPIPTSVDWREKNAVSRVKDQQSCLSSWAFSAVGALESHNFIKTGQGMSFSEQHLMDCSTFYGNDGCHGGTINRGFEFVKERGLSAEYNYPYEGESGLWKCQIKEEKVIAIRSLGFYPIYEGSDAMLKRVVALYGPVSVAVSISSEQFAFYKSGIFTPDFCNTKMINHAMLLIGYGSENGKNFWILKNSWGPEWGENGYMRLSRHQRNACGISTAAAFPIV